MCSVGVRSWNWKEKKQKKQNKNNSNNNKTEVWLSTDLRHIWYIYGVKATGKCRCVFPVCLTLSPLHMQYCLTIHWELIDPLLWHCKKLWWIYILKSLIESTLLIIFILHGFMSLSNVSSIFNKFVSKCLVTQSLSHRRCFMTTFAERSTPQQNITIAEVSLKSKLLLSFLTVVKLHGPGQRKRVLKSMFLAFVLCQILRATSSEVSVLYSCTAHIVKQIISGVFVLFCYLKTVRVWVENKLFSSIWFCKKESEVLYQIKSKYFSIVNWKVLSIALEVGR